MTRQTPAPDRARGGAGPVNTTKGEDPMTTTAAAKPATLTREEAAYAHLASFTRGERVVIGGRARSSAEAVIMTPQRDDYFDRGVTEAYLTAAISGIGGDGGWTRISVADLLSGLCHIEHDNDHQWNGEQTWFDLAGYAAQDPEG